jgi:cytochrome c-type biogenesis protein CcmH
MLDVEAANALREQINIARAEKKLPLLPMASMANAVKPIKIKVTLDKSLAASVKPGSVLFVFAKSLDGKGPPLAAKRIGVDTFPIELELSDADSLMPTAKLSSQKKVSLSARISIQGIANAQVGDIEADALVVDASSENPVEILLSRVKK